MIESEWEWFAKSILSPDRLRQGDRFAVTKTKDNAPATGWIEFRGDPVDCIVVNPEHDGIAYLYTFRMLGRKIVLAHEEGFNTRRHPKLPGWLCMIEQLIAEGWIRW